MTNFVIFVSFAIGFYELKHLKYSEVLGRSNFTCRQVIDDLELNAACESQYVVNDPMQLQPDTTLFCLGLRTV